MVIDGDELMHWIKQLQKTMVMNLEELRHMDQRASRELIGAYANSLDSIIQQQERKMLLYPDMRRDLYTGSDNFIFAAPCTETEWKTLYDERNDDPPPDYLPYTLIKDPSDPSDLTCIILMRNMNTDDQALETAAWLRVSEEYYGMIYAMSFDPAYAGATSLSSIVARTAGVDPKQVKHIELPTKRNLV